MTAIPCEPQCPPVFDRVIVYPLIESATRIEWSLKSSFRDAGPYVFQLQVGRTGNNEADDWVNVGSPVTDTYFTTDSAKHVYGKFQWTHYRLYLTTGDGSYYSTPQNSLGVLSVRDWLRAREIVRMEKLRLVHEAGQDGYLLKRRLYGTACDCVDRQTKDIRNPKCTDCYGTGFVGGYFDPYPCFYVDQGTDKHRSHLDGLSARGTVDDQSIVSGRMLGIPQVFSYDVWVNRNNDFRWFIHSINNIVEVRGVPMVISAEMRLAPFSHIIYTLPIEGQVQSLSCG